MKIRIDHLIISHPSRADEIELLKRLELLIGNTNMKISELAAKVTQQAEVAEKIIVEIKSLKETLEDVDLPENALEAMARLDAALIAADELNPDADHVEDPDLEEETV